MIRAAHFDDVALLADIERAAGAAFCDVGMAAIAGDEPLQVSDLLGYQRTGRAWAPPTTSTDPSPTSFDVVDDCAHIEQVSVHPGNARLGLGWALLDTAAAWAHQRGLPALTLTTFTDVPWNAPYYARLGFRVIRPDLLSPGLHRIREHEAAIGLDAWPRVAMHRPVSAASPVR